MSDQSYELAKAIELAFHAHAEQVDKSGAPYILHPLRVMFNQGTHEGRVVAILHDVIEDTEMDAGDLSCAYEFGEEILDAVDSVTRRDGEDYFAYVARAKANPIGKRVKIADLNDNMDPRRRPANDSNYAERMAKYERALAFLLDKTITKEAA